MSQPFYGGTVSEGRFRLKTNLRLMALYGVLGASALLSACGGGDGDDATSTMTTLSCDDSIKTKFTQDAAALGGETKVLLVKQFKKGDQLVLPNSSLASGITPLTAPADLCLVKLVVGPGLTSEPSTAPSWSQGIGIEVWLPEKSAWNERIRAYGTGGAGGGFHTNITKLGPNRGEGNAFHIAAAGKGYVVSHSDAGHVGGTLGNFTGGTLTWAMKVDGTPNTVLWKDYSERSMHVQAITTKALTKTYYGKEQKYAYWDGQSMGGRQGYKLVQKYPTDFDGYLLGAPAINQSKMQLNHLWPQVVMNVEFGGTVFSAAKSNFISAQAVKACDPLNIGLVIDPLSCKYDPTKDATALCNGVAGNGGVIGTNTNTNKCVTLAEANVFNKIWYGWTRDGSVPDPATYGNGLGTTLAADKGQLWYGITRGTNLTAINQSGVIPSGPNLAVFKPDNSPNTLATDYLALVMESPAYGWAGYFSNATGNGQNKFLELNYASFAYTYDKALAMNDLYFSQANTDNPDLTSARDSNRKVLHYHGWNDEVIAPAGSINYWERVAAYMGGKTELQKFNRLYMIPGYAHDSTFSRSGQIDPTTEATDRNKAPLPQASTGRDELFTALMNWVEKGTAPDRIEVSSADSSISMPICVYPQKAIYSGTGNVKTASSYTCK